MNTHNVYAIESTFIQYYNNKMRDVVNKWIKTRSLTSIYSQLFWYQFFFFFFFLLLYLLSVYQILFVIFLAKWSKHFSFIFFSSSPVCIRSCWCCFFSCGRGWCIACVYVSIHTNMFLTTFDFVSSYRIVDRVVIF